MVNNSFDYELLIFIPMTDSGDQRVGIVFAIWLPGVRNYKLCNVRSGKMKDGQMRENS